ncbi:MAG: response regulator transcription factor [Acidobacteria bacterium]|nr:response regulator transcription factor [Acidobacteriota bacterium]
MLRAYVVDDERLAVQRLTRMLESTSRVEIVGSETDSESALAALTRQPVDVLFLDIQMPGLTGFELIDRLAVTPLVVFTTAYDQYAINAFEVNSIDYLLKPIEPDRLNRTLDKIDRLLGTGPGVGANRDPSLPDVRALARALAGELAPRRRVERIASKVGERTTVLDVSRVSHFTAKDKLTFAVVNGREHVIDYTLAQLEADLDARRFVRIHRGTIVNLAFVSELFPDVDALRQAQSAPSESRGGGVLVRLKDEPKSELSVARDRVRALKDRLGI